MYYLPVVTETQTLEFDGFPKGSATCWSSSGGESDLVQVLQTQLPISKYLVTLGPYLVFLRPISRGGSQFCAHLQCVS